MNVDNSIRNLDDLKFIGVECDVSSERSVQKAYAEIMETYGRIDSVVASAGKHQGNHDNYATPI
jgi:NAD(P)-dependent dehydrogenase (short-subunit alcohol dehydrogenase family)